MVFAGEIDRGLTPTERHICRLLLTRQIVPRRAVIYVLRNPSDNDHRAATAVRVHIHNLRRKLRAKGMEIETIKDSGYRVDRAAKARLEAFR